MSYPGCKKMWNKPKFPDVNIHFSQIPREHMDVPRIGRRTISPEDKKGNWIIDWIIGNRRVAVKGGGGGGGETRRRTRCGAMIVTLVEGKCFIGASSWSTNSPIVNFPPYIAFRRHFSLIAAPLENFDTKLAPPSPLHLQRSIFYSFRVSNLLNDTKARRVLIFSSHRSNRLFKEIFEKSKRKLKFLCKKKNLISYFISVCKDITVIGKTNVSLEFRFSLI